MGAQYRSIALPCKGYFPRFRKTTIPYLRKGVCYICSSSQIQIIMGKFKLGDVVIVKTEEGYTNSTPMVVSYVGGGNDNIDVSYLNSLTKLFVTISMHPDCFVLKSEARKPVF